MKQAHVYTSGPLFGDITMLAGFDEDVTMAIASGARVAIDPAAKSLRVL